MKVMIVDDEVFVRIGIKTTFDWSSHGYEIIGEAEDGMEAVEMFNKFEPDIVLVDVLMPRMNGLEFIKKAKEKKSGCRFIILSCHNEFEYVREAMKLGVRDYIVKTTVKREELLEIVNRVREEILQERSSRSRHEDEEVKASANRPILIKEYINGLLDGHDDCDTEIARKFREFQLDLKVPGLHVLILSIDNYAKIRKEYEPKRYELAISGIANIAQEIFKRSANGVAVRKNDREVVGLVSFERMEREKKGKELLPGIARDIINAVREFLQIGITIAISGEVTAFSHMGTAYRQASRCFERRFFTGFGSIIPSWEPEGESEEFKEVLEYYEKELLEAIRQFDFEKAAMLLKELHGREALKKGRDANFVKRIFLNLALHLIKAMVDEPHGKEGLSVPSFNPGEILSAECLQEVLDYTEQILHSVTEVIDGRFNDQNKNILRRIKEYVRLNTEADITLHDAAQYVSLSPGYFSRLFKKLTGENFIDYVIRCRMDKAKSLIIGGEKLWSIAERLGYTEVSSFSRVFKRIEGISPQQYRLKILREITREVK